MPISRVLVANRAEIARRVFRTCREMGISTVAIYSESDATEPHAREADTAVALHGSTVAETYLNAAAVIEAALSSEADAVHPGYGFLAENADFARAVTDAGLTWIGPPVKAIAAMGSKVESKRIMSDAGVPTVPSVELVGLSSPRTAALSLGFPVLVKASAGGGGKGMRIVANADELVEAIEAAGREAQSAFGDGTVFLEKYLDSPRHIEIQVFADSHGNVTSLFERECSIQRRHQKIIEEAPSVAVDGSLRRKMSEAAMTAARAVGYVGAGTVEFLVEASRLNSPFYFLEMNTRLQVEHPVTEMVTGLDLVRLQIEVAAGEPLPATALHPTLSGHAIEARLYAEDPLNDYLPVTGPIKRFDFGEREDLRVDSGVEAGSTVSVNFDPLLAKIIAHGPDRPTAVSTLVSALRGAHIHSETNNRALLVRILESAEFSKGATDTAFLDRVDIESLAAPLLSEREEEIAALAAALADRELRTGHRAVQRSVPSGWRNVPSQPQSSQYRGDHGVHSVGYLISDGEIKAVGAGQTRLIRATPDLVELDIDGESRVHEITRYGEIRFVDTARGPARLRLLPRFPVAEREEPAGSLHSPMPGKVLRVDVSSGDWVREGQTLLVLEAMKMEHSLKAPHDGQVTEVMCQEGDQVDADTVLVVLADQPQAKHLS